MEWMDGWISAAGRGGSFALAAAAAAAPSSLPFLLRVSTRFLITGLISLRGSVHFTPAAAAFPLLSAEFAA